MRRSCWYVRGFTLFEILVVLVLASLLAAFVAVSTSSVAQSSVIDQADKLRRDVSHLQVLAMGWGVALRLTASSTGYSVTCQSATAGTPCAALGDTPIDPATGQAFSVTLTNGVLLSPAGTSLDFDSLGRPISGTTLISNNPVNLGLGASSPTFSLTGGGNTAYVTIRPITGFAERS